MIIVSVDQGERFLKHPSPWSLPLVLLDTDPLQVMEQGELMQLHSQVPPAEAMATGYSKTLHLRNKCISKVFSLPALVWGGHEGQNGYSHI